MAEDRAKKLIAGYSDLKGGRSHWESHWEDLARVMDPSRLGFISQVQDGDRRSEDILDGTAMQAARGLANTIGAMLRPDGQQWIFVKIGYEDTDLDDEAKSWLANAEQRLQQGINAPRARFRQATGEADLMLAVFGTGIVFTGERPRLRELMFQALPLRDTFVFFNEEGDPVGAYRCRKMTLRQAVEKFGEKNLSDEARELIKAEKYQEKLEFLHAVLPREKGRPGALLAKNLPYSSDWIEVKAAKIVKEEGFHEFPYAVARWDTSSGEDYGRSPGMIALPDANTLQAMEETILVAGQRAADPSLLVPNDGVFDAANSFPGGITYYDAEVAKEMGRIPIGALETGANLPITMEMQQKKREQVFAAFFRNILNLPVEGPQMTAEEIRARKEELLREIGPVFGRLETDYTAPMVERAFKIMLRAGEFGPIPLSLQGRSIRFEYESPVKRIRQQIEAASARAWVMERVELAAAGVPGALDVIDFDEYARFTADAGGVPDKIVLSKDAVEKTRAERAQAQQAEQQMLAAERMAGAAGKAAPALKAMAQPQAAA